MVGAIAVSVPGIPRIEGVAYAGMFFHLTGAAVSHAYVGDPTSAIVTPLVLAALLTASWALRPRRASSASGSPRSFRMARATA